MGFFNIIPLIRKVYLDDNRQLIFMFQNYSYIYKLKYFVFNLKFKINVLKYGEPYLQQYSYT